MIHLKKFNEMYNDADGNIAALQDGAAVRTSGGQVGKVDRVEIHTEEDGKKVTKYLVKIPDTDPERAAKGYKSSGYFTKDELTEI